MVYSTRRFIVCLSVCHFVLVFFSPFSIAIISLGEERANLSAFRTFVRFVLLDLSVISSSWGLRRAAVCDCGPSWTFILPFFFFFFFFFFCLCFVLKDILWCVFLMIHKLVLSKLLTQLLDIWTIFWISTILTLYPSELQLNKANSTCIYIY